MDKRQAYQEGVAPPTKATAGPFATSKPPASDIAAPMEPTEAMTVAAENGELDEEKDVEVLKNIEENEDDASDLVSMHRLHTFTVMKARRTQLTNARISTLSPPRCDDEHDRI